MGVGRMTERVDVYSVIQGQPDGIGGYVTTKELQATLWARVEQDRQALRTPEGKQALTRNSYKVTIRSGAYDITTANLLVWLGKELTIEGVQRDEKHRYTICDCTYDGT